MESSEEEEEIINYDEDDYGQFGEDNNNSKQINSSNKKKEKRNNNQNIITEQDDLFLKKKNNKYGKKLINKKKDVLEKRKKNNLIIVNNVIDLNINQNKNKKKENDKNVNLDEYQTEKNFDIINKKTLVDKQNNIQYIRHEKNINQEYNKNNKELIDKIKELNEENYMEDNQKKNNLLDKINQSNEKEEIEEEEEEEDWEKAKINLITLNDKVENTDKSIELKNAKEKKQINVMEVDEKNMNKKNSNNEMLKDEKISENITNKNIINFGDTNKKNKENIIQDNFIKKDILEKEHINEERNSKKKEINKNFDGNKNEINNNKYLKEFHKEKSIELEQLKEPQNKNISNIFKSANKLETICKTSKKEINKEIKQQIMTNEEINIYTPVKTPKKRNEEILLHKNNNSKKLCMSVNTISNTKLNLLSNSSFNNLLSTRAFRKFLNHKLEQSKIKEDEISKKFLENLPIKEETKNSRKDSKKNKNKNNVTLSNVNYSMFYNEENYEIPLYNKNHRKTINSQYTPKTNSINMNFMKRYNNDISFPQYDNLNDSIIKQEPQRFTTSGFVHFNENISDLTLKNQKLHDKIIELQNEIRVSKNEMNKKNTEFRKYFSSYDKMSLENNLNKEKIDELKKELKLQKGEMNEKQNKISELENINNTLKNEMNKLQKNYDEETTMNKEAKQNYDLIKANYNDIKNQYDLLNIKYQSLTDENFNFKRDKALYEKQIKTKNQMIESLIENKSNILNNKFKFDFNEEKEETNHEMYLDYLKNKNISKEINQKEEKDNGIKKNSEDKNKNGEIDYNKFDRLTYPELQSKRDELVNERKNINNVFSKIPLKSSYKSQIQKRNDLEKKLNDINCDLAIIKLRMKNLKN